MGSTGSSLTLLLLLNKAVAGYAYNCPVTNSTESCRSECCRESCCAVVGEACCQEDCCSKGDWALANSDLIGYIVMVVFPVGCLIYFIYKHRHHPKVARLLRVIGLDRTAANDRPGHNQTNTTSSLPGPSAGVSPGFNSAFSNTRTQDQPSSYFSTGYPVTGTDFSKTPSSVNDETPMAPPPSYSDATAPRQW